MENPSIKELLEKLIKGEITREEFDQFLLKVGQNDQAVELEESLRAHFDQIMEEMETNHPDSKAKPDKNR